MIKTNSYRKLGRNVVLIPETLKKYLSLVFMVFFSLSLSFFLLAEIRGTSWLG